MLFVPIDRPAPIEELQKIGEALELRLDLFEAIDFGYIRDLIRNGSLHVMLTLRKESEGGGFRGSEREREELIRRLSGLEPPFFDLEGEMSPPFIEEMMKSFPKTQYLLSYHNFEKSPADLEKIYHSMVGYEPFTNKIAVMAHSTNEALALLVFGKNHPKTSIICMGKSGEFARILAPIVGNQVDYARRDQERGTAPGQLSLAEVSQLYRYRSLNKGTSIYGLIGDPVEQSLGHLYHNEAFRKLGVDGVYVKMRVRPEELSQFFPLAIELGIRGLSVTMPLKEKVIPFLDEIDPGAKEMGAINTLLFKNGRIIGTNTDGLGALDAIEKRGSVRGKKIVLLGAGGAARAIAFEAKRRGAQLLILNRTIGRAQELGSKLGCEGGGVDQIPKEYDILINCSPDPMPIDPEKIVPETVAMDIVYSPADTPFLQQAISKKCRIIYGEEMFINQAARQTAFWMGI